MIKGIYGVNIAVKNLEEATRKYEAFFGMKARPVGANFFAFPGLVGSQFCINGFALNLIASLEPGTSVASFLERRGEGIFLLSVEVDEIDEDAEKARQTGAAVLLAESARGEFGAVNFVHPKSMAGVQVELYQPSEAVKFPA